MSPNINIQEILSIYAKSGMSSSYGISTTSYTK